jgi:hypothetical protein
MQDQQNQNRNQAQGQQTAGSNWQQENTSAGNNDSTNMNRSDIEINPPHQPRHTEEPVVANQGGTGGNSTQMGQGKQGSERMTTGQENMGGSNGMGGQSNQGEGMRGGSMSDKGKMSDQRGNLSSGGSLSQDSGTDDYMRNEIGSSTTGATGSNRSSNK